MRHWAITTVLTFLIALILAVAAPAQQKPFTRDQVQAMVRDGLADKTGAKAIEQRGIDFASTEDFIQRLKTAGASDAFLTALRAAKHPDRPSSTGDVIMEIARIIQVLAESLAWPIVALTAIFLFKRPIASMLPGSKIKLAIFNLTIETSIPVIEQSVMESLGGRKLTDEQLSLLKQLRSEGRSAFKPIDANLKIARPLRNAGLIKHYPEGGFLQDANEIDITILGRLVVEAAEKS